MQTMKTLRLTLSAAMILAACLAAACSSPGKVPSSYTFEEGAPMMSWSTSKTFKAGDQTVLGMFNNKNQYYPSQAVLTLSEIPDGLGLEMNLELYLVGGWDSTGKNADRFTISAGGQTLVTLDTFPCKLEDGDEKKPIDAKGTVSTGKRVLGYWVVPLAFGVPESAIRDGSVEIVFRGELSGSGTEFWGIDNVNAGLGH